MLIDQLKADLITAQKNQDSFLVLTLRFLMAEIKNLEMVKYPPSAGGIPVAGLPDTDVISVLQKQVKTHNESIAAFKAGNRSDLVQKEEAELAILKKYLPTQMSEEEIREVVKEIVVSGLSDFGQVMREAMGKLRGKADGAVVSKLVREIL